MKRPILFARFLVPRVGLRLGTGLLAAVSILALGPHSSGGQVVGAPVQISNQPDIENEPDVAVSGDVTVAVWMVVNVGCYHNAAYALSGNGGASWVLGGMLPGGVSDRGQPTVCADASRHFFTASMGCVPEFSVSVLRGQYDGTALVWQSPVLVDNVFFNSIPQDRPWIACDPGGSFVYLSYTKDYRQVFFVSSADSGATWSVPVALSPSACSGSRPIVGPDGELYVIWEDYAAAQIVGRKSTDHGASFGAPFVVADVQDDLISPLSWSPNTDRDNPYYGPICWGGFPSIAVDRTKGPLRGALYVSWTEHATGTLSPVTGSVSEVEPNDNFAQATPIQVGQTVYGEEPGTEYITDCDKFTFEAIGGTTLWITGTLSTSSSYGPPPQSWGYGFYCAGDTLRWLTCGVLRVSGPASPVIFTVPETGRYYLRIGCSGPFASASYSLTVQTLEVAPISVARDHRDVMLASSTDGGQTWSPRVRVNDDPPRFDNSLPAVAVDAGGNVHVAWYDRRDAPECGQSVDTYWAYSTDGGGTFHPSQRVSTTAQDIREIISQGWRVGDHLAVAAVSDRVLVLWTQVSANPGIQDFADIYGAVISDVVTDVLVTRLEADVVEGGIAIQWALANRGQFTAVTLERSEAEVGPWRAVTAEQTEHGDLTVAIDRTVEPGWTYWYRLLATSPGGSQSVFGPVQGTAAAPKQFELTGAWPNPTTGGLKAEFALPRGANVRLSVVDLQGREVTVLARGTYAPGRYQVSWDGRIPAGPVPAGLYFLRFRTPDRVLVSRVVVSP